ncbi:IS66 family transposase [Cohnella sp. CIP 111063]|uniref:IS66 family transposase n=1 Tax=unclassified Cohnella TaxID=2636738 RepID=UPI000B8BDEF3|nr:MULTISPECIES: IS66 family transposase [unclassified Cohnella]OXS52121.1 IS66 family transposase [Cohnella sp. CIP 111063]PRX52880.1 transposase [Cohnella sp. SGD-V74]
MENRPKSLTLEQLQQQNAKQEQQIAELSAKLKWYEEQFRLAQQKRFGASSEKTNLDQIELNLFNEAEVLATPAGQEPPMEKVTYERRKTTGKREADLEHLPVETVTYTLAEDEQVCACCGGALHEMTTETRSEIAIVPPQIKVVRHVRQVYACRRCEREEIHTPIVTASMPKPVYPGSLASPSILSHVLCQKYVDGLPLYRQEQIYARLGYTLSRQTMANWMIYGAEQWLTPIFAAMKVHLLKQEVLHADETTLQVLREEGKSAESTSYLWLYRTGSGVAPAVLYEYQRTRGGEHPRNFLSGFKGYLHVDGYPGYHKVAGVTLVGCWAHARRKYDEALKAAPPEARGAETASGQGLAYCNQLFAIERELKEVAPDKRHAARQERSRPIVEAYFAWLKQQRSRTLPKSLLGQAITYSLNQWEKLTAFLADGRLELDNNRSERSIKPFVIGRKNWLFANTPRGAKASAAIYSVIESAKENGLRPYDYLKYLFEQLPQLAGPLDPQTLEPYMPWSQSLPNTCRMHQS